jgi:hypothetical protein
MEVKLVVRRAAKTRRRNWLRSWRLEKQMSKKKSYFAQNKHLDPKLHHAKYFDTLNEAKAWIEKQGGGTVKQRNARTIHSFGQELRVWGEVYETA